MGGATGRREAARGNTRMRFEQWANNPTCGANTLSAVHNVRMADVAAHVGVAPSAGQSPFALARGNTFEASLFRDDGARLVDALVGKDVLPSAAGGLLDVRLRGNGGASVRDLDEAIATTERLIRDLATAGTPGRRAAVPALVAAATLQIPRGVMLPEAVLIVDALAVRTDGDRPELIVGEIKTYADRGGHTNPRDLASARAQAGIYVYGLQLVVDALGVADKVDVSTDGFLVLTSPGSNWPSVRAGEDLRYQAERARRGFDVLERAARALPPQADGAEGSAGADPISAVAEAPTAYSDSCLSFCDLAARCFATALDHGDATVLGADVRRFVGNVTLDRVEALLGGAPPVDETEADLVRRISEADSVGQLQ